MKQWFKYEYGYVNLDDKNMYLTNSGNWSDTISLKEYEKKVKSKMPSNGLVYLVIVGIIFGLLFFMNIISDRVSLVLIIGLPLAGIAVYNYMKTEIGGSFLIPLSKLNNIEISEETILISFNDLNGFESSYELIKVSTEGLKQMESIKKNIISNHE